jgi:octaprenyl-diphosphate synthase
MASEIDEVKQFIKIELANYDDHFKNAMKSNTPLLDKITRYIVKSKGKQMRPMFVFLSSKIFGDTNPNSYTAASMIELLHTASLVHDDIVDEAYQRRGFFSINALWKNKVAVLVGDYLLAQGLNIAVETNQFKMLQIINRAVKQMAEGELLQLEKARRLDIKEEIYYEIIKKKTATLIAASCCVGANANTQDDDIIEHMHKVGESIGMAFQIKDDLFDFGDKDVGKPLGIDIKEKKMTLPLIYSLNNTDYFTKRKIINIIKNESNNPSKVNEVINFVKKGEGIIYTKEKMNEFHGRSLKLISECPQNESTEMLKKLIQYVISRDK